MLWAFLAFLAIVIAVLLLLPLPAGAEDGTDAVAFYKAQLRALEADRGEMEEKDYREAELELQRRLLSAARAAKGGGASEGPVSGNMVQIATLVAVLAGSAGMYAWLGRPDVEEAPAPARIQFESQVVDDQGTTIADRLAVLTLQAESDPANADLLKEIAVWYSEARNYTAAALTYQELALLEPDSSEWPLRQFEAMNILHQGQIPPAAAILLDRLIVQDPRHPAVHFYRGLQFKQAGNLDQAKAVWLALRERSPADAPWLRPLNEGLASIDPALVPQLAEQQAVSERAAEVANMSPEERLAFIQSMIGRLEARMADEPENAEGWLMLARAKAMTGDNAGARGALQQALENVAEADKPQIQAALDQIPAN